jgi:hypothetical protein
MSKSIMAIAMHTSLNTELCALSNGILALIWNATVGEWQFDWQK